MSDVGEVARAIDKAIEAFMMWVKGGDKRRLRAGVDIADRIFKRYKEVKKHPDKTILKWIDEFYNKVV